MRRETNPAAWSAWGAAVTLTTVVTRNPLYLGLVLLATVVVHIGCRAESGTTDIWNLVIRIGGVVAILSVAFNLLTAHAGDHVLFEIPSVIPIVGGIITANALLYGVTSAIAIFSLIVMAATFASVVDRAALLRSVPRPLASAGIAAVIGLSFFPQTLASLRTVREAQAARGFRVRSVRDVVPLVVPVLSLGLEGAFDLAEAMESRAYGQRIQAAGAARWLFPAGIVLTIASVSLLIGGMLAPAALLGAAAVAIVAAGLFGDRRAHSRYRQTRWRYSDWIIAGSSGLSMAISVAAVLFFSSAIEWSPFPTLATPPFSPFVGIACLLLAVPAIVSEGSA